MSIAPTGTQHLLVHGDQQAVVTELGATLRSYTVAGREVVTTFDEDRSPLGCQGQHMMPWPNRVRDGRWLHEGEQLQLPLTEPERGNAIHGLVCWVPWSTVAHDEGSLTQRYLLHPQPGWPGVLELLVTHSLDEQGLTVAVRATNVGGQTVPFGYGAHPYLLSPAGSLDDASLRVPFATTLAVDQRLLPVERRGVEGSVADLREAKRLLGVQLDTAFTDASLLDGRWGIELLAGEHGTLLWGDEQMRWAQLYTPGDQRSIAVEPMTCGPDAFNPGPTHDEQMLLAPGEAMTCSWGLRAW